MLKLTTDKLYVATSYSFENPLTRRCLVATRIAFTLTKPRPSIFSVMVARLVAGVKNQRRTEARSHHLKLTHSPRVASLYHVSSANVLFDMVVVA